jgi:hypothetical protein
MKNIGLVVCLSVALFSCEKNIDRNSKEYDVRQIYKVLVDRSAMYNNVKINVSKDLLDKRIDAAAMTLIRKGLRNYNSEIQNSIDAYNQAEDSRAFIAGLKHIGARKSDKTNYQLSKVGFNVTREYAVVYEADTATQEISHRSFLFFRKIDGEWNIETEIME